MSLPGQAQQNVGITSSVPTGRLNSLTRHASQQAGRETGRQGMGTGRHVGRTWWHGAGSLQQAAPKLRRQILNAIIGRHNVTCSGKACKVEPCAYMQCLAGQEVEKGESESGCTTGTLTA